MKFLKVIKRLPFRVNYILKEFIRRNFTMKITYRFPQYSPHVGGKGSKFDKATEYNINNLPKLLSEISTSSNKVEIIKLNDLTFTKETENKIVESFNRHKSDKVWQGKFEKIYSYIFDSLTPNPKNILEIGIGSKNKKYLSYMGKNEKTGASIRAFKEIFPKANVIAADVDIKLQDKLKEESIELNFVDQMNETTVRDLFKSIDYELDLIIDDGLHLESSNLLVLKHGLSKLSIGGCMVIEDIGHSALKTWLIVANLLSDNYRSQIIDRDGLGYCFLIYRHLEDNI
jgi:hypothetical protein